MNAARVFASGFVVACLVGALPIRKYDLNEIVEKVTPATDTEKKDGILATVFLKDRKEGIHITKDTAMHLQMGKLVPVAEVGGIKPGSRVSIWLDAKRGVAEGVLIFP